jgi:hypothetical protein
MPLFQREHWPILPLLCTLRIPMKSPSDSGLMSPIVPI